MAEKKSAVRAREAARKALADRVAAARQRERENEADLATYFEQDSVIEEAAASRDAAIAKANKAFESATANASAVAAEALARMSARGETAAELAAVTGLSLADVRRHLSSMKKKAEPKSSTAGDPEVSATETTAGAATTEPESAVAEAEPVAS
ncbi:hypothetical protein P9990_27070 (plasmid) [Prescottella equi]|uniref:hypothetical protein n=1 Tax=Rhodococcus hoagii TaxID=43767 RepID=UPI0025783253|nr:hypothetical protein [Prescottella equi]WJJ14704.1 hypothetical protein P9990_27070 [Prescottella equi]